MHFQIVYSENKNQYWFLIEKENQCYGYKLNLKELNNLRLSIDNFIKQNKLFNDVKN